MRRNRPKKRAGNRITGLWLVIMSVFLAELLFYTWCRLQYTRVGYEISDGMDHQQRLLTDRQNLKIELARLKSPDRIERIARRKLNLTTPTPEQVIIIP